MAEREKVKIEIEAWIDPENSKHSDIWNDLVDDVRIHVESFGEAGSEIDLFMTADRTEDYDE